MVSSGERAKDLKHEVVSSKSDWVLHKTVIMQVLMAVPGYSYLCSADCIVGQGHSSHLSVLSVK